MEFKEILSDKIDDDLYIYAIIDMLLQLNLQESHLKRSMIG